jgi:hypothetical protein
MPGVASRKNGANKDKISEISALKFMLNPQDGRDEVIYPGGAAMAMKSLFLYDFTDSYKIIGP